MAQRGRFLWAVCRFALHYPIYFLSNSQRIRNWGQSSSDSPTLVAHAWTTRMYVEKCKLNWLHLNPPRKSNLIKNLTVILEVESKPHSDPHAVHWEVKCYNWSHFIWKSNHDTYIIKEFLKGYLNIKEQIILEEKKLHDLS